MFGDEQLYICVLSLFVICLEIGKESWQIVSLFQFSGLRAICSSLMVMSTVCHAESNSIEQVFLRKMWRVCFLSLNEMKRRLRLWAQVRDKVTRLIAASTLDLAAVCQLLEFALGNNETTRNHHFENYTRPVDFLIRKLLQSHGIGV